MAVFCRLPAQTSCSTVIPCPLWHWDLNTSSLFCSCSYFWIFRKKMLSDNSVTTKCFKSIIFSFLQIRIIFCPLTVIHKIIWAPALRREGQMLLDSLKDRFLPLFGAFLSVCLNFPRGTHNKDRYCQWRNAKWRKQMVTFQAVDQTGWHEEVLVC